MTGIRKREQGPDAGRARGQWHVAATVRVLATGMSIGLAAWAVQAQDAEAEKPRLALKVCQDPNNMPFSNLKGEGIENRIAEVFGQALGIPVSYYSFPQRLAFIRNTLRYKLPGQDFRCDIVMGVPVGYDQGVSVTKPYYRSTYAIVFAKSGPLAGLAEAENVSVDGVAALKGKRIGVHDRSPASAWLAKHGLVEEGVPYKTMDANPDAYPGAVIERDLAEGKLDAAIVWGPVAGYFAKKVTQPQLAIRPLQSEPGVRFDYEMAMGVRYGEREWKQQVESLIDSQRPAIEAILREYNVPLVEEGERSSVN